MADTPESGLPETLSLGEVLADIRLTPGEIAHLLQHFGQMFSGSSQPELTSKFNQAAVDVTTPDSAKPKDEAPTASDSPVAPPVLQPMETTQAPDRMTPPEAGQDAPRQDVNRPLEPPLAQPDQNR